MENQINTSDRKYNRNTVFGFALLFIGLSLLLKNSGLFLFPHWLFS